MVGGGSGGHITPLLAVAHKLHLAAPEASIDYVIEKGSRFTSLPESSTDVDTVYKIRAGKFRRYHGESFVSHVFDISTNLKNIRDFFYLLAGSFQSWRLLGRLRPDAVFIKGGFVGVPVGMACRLRGVPYFTHDSDTVPGLANKLIAGRAAYHAVGMPAEFYNYPKQKTRYTGIPLSTHYQRVDTAAQKRFRQQLGLADDALVMTVTGGSLGAQRLNTAVCAVAEQLLTEFPKLQILHQTGSKQALYQDLGPELKARVVETQFTDVLYAFTGAADIVVTRAGATTVAELAVQGKACVIVPNPQLTGGQQSHNAAYLEKHKAAVIVSEKQAADAAGFAATLRALLQATQQRQALATALGHLAKPDADEALTAIILELATNKK